MIDAFRTVQKKYEALAGVDMDITFENAVVLLRKIRSGDRPDVLVSPGRLEMEMMEKEGYVDPDSVATFGTFKMILVVPKDNDVGIHSWNDLTRKDIKSIALANADENSVGYYAEEALKKLGLLEKLEPKIRRNWHALTVVKWICRGRVDAGLYFDSCPFTSGQEKLEGQENTYRIVCYLPEDSYPPIKVQAGRLKESPNPEAANRFLAYLVSEEGQKLLAEEGIPNFKGAESEGEKST